MRLLAIDGNSILNRAFYGIKLLSNKQGVFTNAIFGFMNIYFKNFDEIKPDCVAVAFDLSAPTFRHKAVMTYKANRHGIPPELVQQLPIVKNLLMLMGIKIVECEGYEADDILGTLSKVCTDSGNECFILTGDRDSLQLIDNNVTVMLATNKGDIKYTPEKFNEDYGFAPVNLVDLKALMGDSSDNISGVAGIGEKTASMLVKEYGTIENLYAEYENSKLAKGIKTKLANGENSAKESKWLVTIVRDAPIDKVLENYKIGVFDTAGLSKLLTELEMYKLLEKLNISVHSAQPEQEEYESVEITEKDLTEDIINNFSSVSYLFDGINLAIRDGNSVYRTNSTELVCAFLASECEKITDNAKSHYHFAMTHEINLLNLKSDASICGYLLNTSSSDYSTERLCAEYGVHYYAENGTSADLISLDGLIKKLRTVIEKEGMTSLLDNIEMPLIEVLASMEHTGIEINQQGVKDFGVHLSEMIEETQQMIFDDVGHEFNISSPKQLGVVLFEELGLPIGKKTKSGYSTNADVLENLRSFSPVVDNVLKYRQYTKLNSTYVVGLLDKVADDGRIHTCFKQTETRTGRISSTEPNMQNIPVRTELGSQMRKFFVAEEGKVLVDADYSQIELRVMAHLCGDKNMISAFNSGEDIHTMTASQVFDTPAIMVTHEMRSNAKAVNFGIIYGISEFSLSKDINVSVAEARKYIADYFSKYPEVKKFIDKTVSDAKKSGTVSTMFGRKRYIPEIKSSNKMVQKAGERIAMNTPVQGTSADLIKIAMINVHRRLKSENLSAKLILQVHDELIIESEISCAERCAEILREEMMNVCEMKVPLLVDVNKGGSWYDAKG